MRHERKPVALTTGLQNALRKNHPTFGQSDHQAPWRDPETGEWTGRIGFWPVKQVDEDFYYLNPHRRLHLRLDLPCEVGHTDPGGQRWVVVVRSKHDHAWNRIALRFLECPARLWDVPTTDDAALAIVGRFAPRVMLDAALLLVSPRYVCPGYLFAFDLGAVGEVGP